ncbi:MAG: response regulator transcription factor [Saprospiraceae bacterium]|nr:response regulator transcription factor [Saprospiraceae bacterium]
MKAHLLYVEDDATLSFVTRDNLSLQGYKITHCEDGEQALEVIRNEQFDLCILDVMLPQIDGYTLAKEIRKKNIEVPIIFLTAKSLKEDKIHGLKLGADDYITKPFSIEELLLKIEVFLRRSKITQPQVKAATTLGKYEFNYANLSLIIDEESRQLTQKEADLLQLFAASPNEVLKRATILERLWGENDYFMGRSLDVFISRLRKYLKKDEQLKIENIHGVGFKFVCPARAQSLG